MYLKKSHLYLPRGFRAGEVLKDLSSKELYAAQTIMSRQASLSSFLKQSFKDDYDVQIGYVGMDSDKMNHIIGLKGSFGKIMTSLVNNGVFTVNKSYEPGKKTKEYCLTPKYQLMKWEQVYEENLYPDFKIGRYKSPNTRLYNSVAPREKLPKEYIKLLELTDIQFDKLKIRDCKPLRALINKRAKRNYNKFVERNSGEVCIKNRETYNLEFFIEQELSYINRINSPSESVIIKSNGRLYNKITNLPREYRQYLFYGDDNYKLISVDVKTCQPFMFSTFYNDSVEDRKERESYLNFVTNNDYYRYLGKAVGINDREAAKEEGMYIAFGSMKSQSRAMAKFFAELFPTLAIRMNSIREVDYTKIPIELQQLESQIMIQGVLPAFQKLYPDQPAFTIHDSFLVLPEFVQIIQDLIIMEFNKVLGRAPNLKVETVSL